MAAIFEQATSKDSLAFYFPSILNDSQNKKVRNPAFRNFEQNWYSSSLYSLKEPILFTKKDNQTIYRLLWLRSFHPPVSFTLKEFNGNYYLNTKMIDRQPAFYPEVLGNCTESGNLILDTLKKADRLAFIKFNEVLKINYEKWEEFENIIAKNDFWSLSSPIPPDYANDGSNWILEGYSKGKYHFIARRNLHEDVRECANFFLKQTGLKLSKGSIY